MTDFVLDTTTHDLVISNKDISLFQTYPELIRQRVKINLLSYKGEWFRDINNGIPYIQSILGKRNTQAIATTFIKNAIVETEGIQSILDFQYTLGNDRELVVTFSAKIDDGSLIENLSIEV